MAASGRVVLVFSQIRVIFFQPSDAESNVILKLLQEFRAFWSQPKNTSLDPFDKSGGAQFALRLKRIRNDLIYLLLVVPFRSGLNVRRKQLKACPHGFRQLLCGPQTTRRQHLKNGDTGIIFFMRPITLFCHQYTRFFGVI